MDVGREKRVLPVDVRAEKRALLDEVQKHVDARYRKAMGSVVPTGLKILGVRVPVLRKAAADWQRAHKTADRDDVMKLVEALWDGESREERMLAVYTLSRYKRFIPDLTWKDFDRWRRRVDNWETGDGLAMWVLSPWIAADQGARLDHLRALIADSDMWSRRLALVATVPLNRTSDGPAASDLTFELVDVVKEERGAMMTKAVSWALRGMAKTHPSRVAAYIRSEREILAPHVVKEVTSKLETGLKSGKPTTSR